MTLMLSIPTPPSANAMWRSVGGRNILSADARTWKRVALAVIRSQLPLSYVRLRGPVLLRALVEVPTLASDVSNRIKLLEDALTEAGVWDDDRQVAELRVHKDIGPRDRCETRLWVEPLDHPEMAARLEAARKRPRRTKTRKLKGGVTATPNVRRGAP